MQLDNSMRREPTDPAERIAQAFLSGSGYHDVVYEPDGNVPPDFLIGGRIAVEVRRLNHNVRDQHGAWRGLEQVQIPLVREVRRTLHDLGPPESGRSWYVHYQFKRPIPRPRVVAQELAQLLESFRTDPHKAAFEARLPCGVHVRVLPTGEPHSLEFVLAGYNDHDSGGWLLSVMKQNLALVMSEKAGKVAPFRTKYNEWWLMLVDMIGWGLSEFDRRLFREAIRIEHEWDRVVLLDPRDPSRWFDV